MPLLGGIFYTTNLPGGGTDGVFAINIYSKKLVGSIDAPFPIPHNLSVNLKGNKLYVTHSGATANKVSVYKKSRGSKIPEYVRDITVGLNPFGISPTF
jgi:DNA-binding beta-propeller fold protein YncE